MFPRVSGFLVSSTKWDVSELRPSCYVTLVDWPRLPRAQAGADTLKNFIIFTHVFLLCALWGAQHVLCFHKVYGFQIKKDAFVCDKNRTMTEVHAKSKLYR